MGTYMYNKQNLFNQTFKKNSKSNCPILTITELLLTCYPGLMLLDRPLDQAD